ncbi:MULTISPECIES: LutC/YkgG family protein [Bacillaceae]|uniref:LutC/YkgG family protein n=1 Tax=Bacillaceae TaxID=186817 RepID=UPI000BFD4937|nr:MULTISPECIES: lactate utilization protein C [Bacillaceae]PGT88603.1 lactate utilization protein C [Bacillus sp. AFS040349]UGB31897.1 lactate utilization protein C [Metabacillus sp. B2-18]UHA60158.1 lactate utilization protein C [Metabacillus litoralis]
MTGGSIQNQETFLNKIASQLGREQRTEGVTLPEWKHQPQWDVLQGLSQDQLVDVLKEQCRRIQTQFVETTSVDLVTVLKNVVKEFGGGPIITWNDDRFTEFGLTHLLHEEWPSEDVDVSLWNPSLGKKNIELAEQANVGITFSDKTLAESGTVVLFSDTGKGRSVSLLPATYIAIIPKSTIVPRITQVSQEIHENINKGEEIASCVNFITGPSNSADIEMNLVVGVHGPIKATYILVNDK